MVEEEKKESAIKVSDVVEIKEKTIADLSSVIKTLKDLGKQYTTAEDIVTLERLKREYNANLQYMAQLYAKTRALKGTNHVYLEGAVKKIKSETIELLMATGHRVTAAENLVYAHPYYTERLAVIQGVIQFCLKVELLYDQFNSTLTCIVQSISVANKEFGNSKMVG